jgi:hypothetical protein
MTAKFINEQRVDWFVLVFCSEFSAGLFVSFAGVNRFFSA